MALRIEKAFGADMELLLNMQLAYDVFQTRLREKTIKVRPYRKPNKKTVAAMRELERGGGTLHRTIQDIWARNADADPDEIQSIVDQAVSEVRAERHAKKRQ